MVVADLHFNGVLFLYLHLYFKRAVVQLLLTRHVALTCCADTAQGGYDLVMQTFDFFGSQKELGEMGLASFRTFCKAVDVPLKSKGIDTLFMVPFALVQCVRVSQAHGGAPQLSNREDRDELGRKIASVNAERALTRLEFLDAVV